MAEESLQERDPKGLQAMSLRERKALFQGMVARTKRLAEGYSKMPSGEPQGWEWAIREAILGVERD